MAGKKIKNSCERKPALQISLGLPILGILIWNQVYEDQPYMGFVLDYAIVVDIY